MLSHSRVLFNLKHKQCTYPFYYLVIKCNLICHWKNRDGQYQTPINHFIIENQTR